MHSKAEVVIKDGAEPRGKYLLGPGEYVIGRSESCDIVLKGAGISYRHAQFVITPSRLVVIDLNSTNGTFVGEHRVEGAERISSGDRIRIGAKGIAEIRLIENGENFAPSDGNLSESGKSNTEGEILDSRHVVEKGREELPPESTTADLDAICQIEKLRADYEGQVRAIEQERVVVVRDRDELLKRLERVERENKAQAAAAVEDWTAMIHEKERALEDLAELRVAHEYQQKENARKIEELRTTIRELDESLRALASSREEKKCQLAAIESKSSRESRERDTLLATTAQAVELQKSEIAGLLQKINQQQKEKESADDDVTRFKEAQDARLKEVRNELETALRERDALLGELIGVRGHGNCSESGPCKVYEIRNLAPNSETSPSAKVGDLMIPEEPAVIDDVDMPESSEGKGGGEATHLPSVDHMGILPRTFMFVPKKYLWRVGILCASVGVTFGAIAGYSAYQTRQLRDLTESAVGALARGDQMEASLSTRRALQIDENYLPACKLMAEIGEKMGDPRAVTWRQRVVELAPGSVDELIAQASTALRFGKQSIAAEALERVGDSDRARADYQAVSGSAALAAGNRAEAERCYSEAVRLAPDNPIYRVDLGTVQSGSADYFTKETGRRVLTEIAENPKVAARALRSLIASYEMTQELSAALRASWRLRADGSAVFGDEIVHLRLLRRTGDPLFGKGLTDLQTKAAKKPDMATSLVAWMNAEGLASEAVAWVADAFPEIAKTPGLRASIAVSLASTRDWSTLLELTKIGPWIEAEYGRQAYRALGMHEEGQVGLAHGAWKNALVAGSSEPDALAWLAHMAAEWNWPDEREEALLAMVSSASKSRAALKSLSRRYLAERNTAGLRLLAARLMGVDPSNDEAQNDYAILSLLLDTDVPRALRLARDLYDRHPDGPGYVSTYAFALNYEGRSEEALQTLEKLSPAKLEEPGFAAYYGIILVANQRPEKAVRYLQIARNAPLLREELLLVEKSLQQVGGADPKPN